MDPKDLKRISKFLSLHLRHEPEALGLELEPGGWVPVEALLRACEKRRMKLTPEILAQVVAENDKQRFSFSPDGTRIRANQGHSVEVDLGLEPVAPPERLYHGTAQATLAPIRESGGLRRMGRHHVHLSPDEETARRVGARHGKPVVLAVAARRMAEETGAAFYCSANGVWLVESVPLAYLEFPAEAQ